VAYTLIYTHDATKTILVLLLSVVGRFDPLQDWQRRYAVMLQRRGKAVRVVEFPEAIHGFPELADAGRVLTEIKAFVESSTSMGVAE
jgi:acetyl esterase/lipase